MGYITIMINQLQNNMQFQSSFELMGYITTTEVSVTPAVYTFQSSFELMGYITPWGNAGYSYGICFKALSSLWVI